MRATLPERPSGELALLRIGAGIATGEARDVLDALYDRLAVGGFVIVDTRAHAATATRSTRSAPSVRIDEPARAHRRVGGRVAQDATGDRRPRRPRGRASSTGAPRPPLAPEAPADAVDLSVVVVFYNMRREAARTLQSLSRSYQEELDDIDYEVIVVENGSDESEKLGADFVRELRSRVPLPRPRRRRARRRRRSR